jgi:hypothetical protein
MFSWYKSPISISLQFSSPKSKSVRTGKALDGPGCGLSERSIMLFCGAYSTVLLLGRTTIYVLKNHILQKDEYMGAVVAISGVIGENR